MNVVMATDPCAPGQPNEDFVGAVPSAVVLLDGAGIPGTEAICRHGVAWYTHGLGGELLGRLSGDGRQDLVTILGDAIDQIAARHRDTCDIANPSSPQATVMIFRTDQEYAEFLALGDSFLITEQSDGAIRVVTDEREVTVRRNCLQPLDDLTPGTTAYEQALAGCITTFRARRNQPGGYWIAKDDRRAAAEAVTGRMPVQDLSAAALLSNGASRFVDPYALGEWSHIPDLLRRLGPAGVIGRVRRAEAGPRAAALSATSKAADDATIAYITRPLPPNGAAQQPPAASAP